MILLLAVLGLAAGTVLWLTVESDSDSPEHSGSKPLAEVSLVPDQSSPHAPTIGPTALPTQPAKAAPGLALTPPASAAKNRPTGLPPTVTTDRALAVRTDAGATTPEPPPPRSARNGSDGVAATLPLKRASSAEPPFPALPPALRIPRAKTGPPLRVAPDSRLVQRTNLGLLPVIGADGRKPWKVYARPFNHSDKRPKIALVITGLGLSSAATETAIQSLPGAVTLAFAPYAARLSGWIRLARAAGHEVLLNVPMEPVNYPTYDPGPQALLTSLTLAENRERLLWTLGRATGYVGVADFMGSQFTMSRKHLRPVLATLNKRGLLFLDSHTAPRSLVPLIAREIGLPVAVNSRFIDVQASRDAIDERLKEIERTALTKRIAVGMGSPYPVTLERVAAWAEGLGSRGFVLAPISALVETGSEER